MTHYLVQYLHHMDAISISLCDHMTRCFGGNHDFLISLWSECFKCDPSGKGEGIHGWLQGDGEFQLRERLSGNIKGATFIFYLASKNQEIITLLLMQFLIM